MAKQIQAHGKVAKTPKVRRIPTHVSVYSNNFSLSVSNWDFTFGFGEIVDQEPDGTLIVDEKVTVKTSPQHARAMLAVLADNIKLYESKYGEIQWESKVEVDKTAI